MGKSSYEKLQEAKTGIGVTNVDPKPNALALFGQVRAALRNEPHSIPEEHVDFMLPVPIRPSGIQGVVRVIVDGEALSCIVSLDDAVWSVGVEGDGARAISQRAGTSEAESIASAVVKAIGAHLRARRA